MLKRNECKHVYETFGTAICHFCGGLTNDINWRLQNELRTKWHLENPDAEYEGWMSI